MEKEKKKKKKKKQKLHIPQTQGPPPATGHIHKENFSSIKAGFINSINAPSPTTPQTKFNGKKNGCKKDAIKTTGSGVRRVALYKIWQDNWSSSFSKHFGE